MANYIKFSPEKHKDHIFQGLLVYDSPLNFQPEADFLFRNNGDGTFTDVSQETNINSLARNGMGMICADCDHDGDTDSFVGSDCQENLLFLNLGNGTFEEAGLFNGVAVTSLDVSNIVRAPHTGRIRNYILFAAGVAAIAVLVLLLIGAPAAEPPPVASLNP